MGVEFDDFDREPFWQGMPRTHGGVVPLRLLNKSAKATYSCSAQTNLKELAGAIAALIPEACSELDARCEKLRRTYETLLNSQVQNTRKRMAILAERRSKELRTRRPKAAAAPSATFAEKLNLPEILETLLKSKSDQRHELEVCELDEREAHAVVVTGERIAGLVRRLRLIESELTELLGKPVESGATEHRGLPVNDVEELEELRTWPLHCAWNDLQHDLVHLCRRELEHPLLPIGTDGSGNYFCLVLSGDQRGAVLFVEHGNLENCLLANSFDELLETLRPRHRTDCERVGVRIQSPFSCQRSICLRLRFCLVCGVMLLSISPIPI